MRDSVTVRTEAANGEVLYKKGVVKNSAKFTGQHLCQSLFLVKLRPPQPATLFNKRLWQRCFNVNCAKFSKIPVFQSTFR